MQLKSTSEHAVKNWLIPLLSPFWFRGLASALLVIIRSVLLLCPPLLTRAILDEALPNHDGRMLVLHATGIIAVPVIISAMFIWDLYISTFVLDVAARIRGDLFDGLQRRPLTWYKSTKMGDLVNRLLDETQEVAQFGYQGIGSLVWSSTTVLAGLGIMAWMDWLLALFVCGLLVVQTFLIKQLGARVRTNAKAMASANSAVMEHVRETVNGIQYIKNVGREQEAIEELEELLDDHYVVYRQNLMQENLSNLIKVVIAGVLLAGLYYFGGLRVVDGSITVGSLVAIVALYVWLGPAVSLFQTLYMGAKRVSPLLDRIEEIRYNQEGKAGEQVPRVPVEIEIAEVNFSHESEYPTLREIHDLDSSYQDARHTLRDINLAASSGDFILLVGPSGSGKSTLSDLLLRLQEPTSGSIRFSGVSLTDVSEHWLGQHVLCVAQDVQLRTGTLRENLLYAKPDADDAELAGVLQVAGLHEWFHTLPDGLDTHLGERASRISGGERQRLSVARAILRQPAVLILDEATSDLDNLTEQLVIRSLRQFLPTSTILMITHRLAVAPEADQIYVLRAGSVVEAGSHEELLEVDGLYASLYRERETV